MLCRRKKRKRRISRCGFLMMKSIMRVLIGLIKSSRPPSLLSSPSGWRKAKWSPRMRTRKSLRAMSRSKSRIVRNKTKKSLLKKRNSQFSSKCKSPSFKFRPLDLEVALGNNKHPKLRQKVQ